MTKSKVLGDSVVTLTFRVINIYQRDKKTVSILSINCEFQLLKGQIQFFFIQMGNGDLDPFVSVWP